MCELFYSIFSDLALQKKKRNADCNQLSLFLLYYDPLMTHNPCGLKNTVTNYVLCKLCKDLYLIHSK